MLIKENLRCLGTSFAWWYQMWEENANQQEPQEDYTVDMFCLGFSIICDEENCAE